MALSQRLATAILQLTTDTSAFVRGINEAQSQAAKSVDALGAHMQKVGKSMQSTGAAMTTGLTVPILAIAGGALKLATDFESSFAGIRKTVGDATDQFGKLTDTGRLLETGMRDLAKEIPLGVDELNNIGEAAGQLGIKSENVLKFTEVMAALGVTTNLTAEQAATALARFANITQMPQEHFDRLGSTIVALGNNLATTEEEIVEMGLRLAGAGEQIGLSEAEIMAIAGALSSVGINAEAGGSAMSKVMIDMATSVDQGGDRLKQFADVAGVSSAKFAEKFRTDAAGALTDFITGLGHMDDKGKTTLGVLGDMEITEVRMRDALLRASGAGDLLATSIDIGTEAWRDNSALTKEAEERYKTTASQMTLLWNNIKDVGIQLGQVLLPVLQRAIETLRGFVPYLEKAVEWFKNLSPTTQTVVIAIGGLVAALGPALVVIGTLTVAIGAALPVLSTVGGAILAFVTGPIALIVAAVAGLAFVWIKWGDDITRVVSETWTAVKTWLWDKLGPVLEPIGGLLQSVAGFFQAFHELVWAVLQLVVEKVAAMVTGVIGWLRDKLAPVFEPVLAQFRLVATVAGEVGQLVIGYAKTIYEGVKTWLLDKFTGIVDGIKGKIDAVAGFFRDLKDKVVGHSYIPDMVGAIVAETVKLDTGFVGKIQTQTASVGGFFAALKDTVLGHVGSLVDKLGSTLSTSLSSLFGGGSGGGLFGSLVGGGLSAVFGPGGIVMKLAGQGLEALGKLAWEGLKKIGGYFKDLFGGPSAKELAGREVVANFEANVQSMLNERQKLEAGNESWKKTVIVVRDAYLALGRTEAEALAAVEALWKSSKGGAEAVERAMHPIQAALDEVAKRSEATGLSLDELRADGMAAGQGMAETFSGAAQTITSIGDLGASAVRRIQDSFSGLSFDIPVKFAVAALAAVPMAAGGAGVVTRPTLFLAGEAGPEEYAFSGANHRFSAGGDGVLAGKFDRLERALLFALPSMVERAARHGAQTSGRRR